MRGAELYGWPRCLSNTLILLFFGFFVCCIKVVRAGRATGDVRSRYSGHPYRWHGSARICCQETERFIFIVKIINYKLALRISLNSMGYQIYYET